ncbi:MAG TPA: 16S rRNA (guanine(527)-N(7))-methyltransferase RsmG [Gammaproteobacteria bacterium]|nr:16S rRNA (guanine(527)-N(7))-methyltransferase RsmG [Gammaproteobacteria bacterium]
MGKAEDLKTMLAEGVDGIGLEVDDQGRSQILGYLSLLKRWNRVYNLTTVKSDTDFVTRHLLDSLSIVPYLHGRKIIDIGSGAGLPGIPVALACPDKEVTLLDSNAKRCRFLRQVQAQLKLHNVSIVQQRAEKYHPHEKFDSLLSRAFSSLSSFIACSGHLIADGGQLLAMKGQWPGEEPVEMVAGFRVEGVIKLNVPGLPEQRHLVICKKTHK